MLLETIPWGAVATLVIVVVIWMILRGHLVPKKELSYWRDHYRSSIEDRRHQRTEIRWRLYEHEYAEITSKPVRVEDADWCVVLGLNTSAWRVTDPDDGSDFITYDVGVAIDNLDWGCSVDPIEEGEV